LEISLIEAELRIFSTPKGTNAEKAENASFDVLIDYITSSAFAVGDDKKNREGKEREGTQSHKTLYFSYLWGGHPSADCRTIWHA